jgi:glycosyltransferase involved in cell wall biosynthesis
MALLSVNHPAIRLLLVGGGPQANNLKALAAARGLSERVLFAGRVPHADVHRYYGLIDVLAYPRRSMRLTEIVTPLKPLEAMAQGRLFVASDVGGHRELVRDGITGSLFPAGYANLLALSIENLLAKRDEWPAMLTRARRFVETERTWSRSVAHYEHVYETLCSAPEHAMAPGK